MFQINIIVTNKVASYVGRPIERTESDGQTSMFSLHAWHSPGKLKSCIADCLVGYVSTSHNTVREYITIFSQHLPTPPQRNKKFCSAKPC